MTRKLKEFVNHYSGFARPGHQVMEQADDHVAVLLALYNGAATFTDQYRSIEAQTHANWSLIVSDDGSTDAGPDMVLHFARHAPPGRVTLTFGPSQGHAQNFLSLIRSAGSTVPYAALSDQDDVWMPDKLARALTRLKTVSDGTPALYAGRTVICDEGLRPLRRSPLFALPPGFANALVQSIGGGNTMVLNRAALDLVQDTSRQAKDIVAHDWWIYQIVSGAGGTVIYDPEPAVYYRQHGGNLVGANDSPLAGLFRVAQVLRGRFRRWNGANLAALEAARHWLTPEARETLRLFCAARDGSLGTRLRALKRAGLYRQTRRGNVALRLAAVLKRI